ncbi:MAG: ribosome recycling factor [Actinomycetia bacterium]|nr:ribosome recycling factor [Actinomycetes bacterium]
MREALDDASKRMDKAVKATAHEFASVRTGRASASLLERISFDYYGTLTPLNQAATINVPEPQMIVIQPYDKSNLAIIEKAIQQSDLGLSPSNDGNIIRVPFPPLTEERRLELVKIVKKLGEEGKVAVRNVRRDVNDKIKTKEKNHEISQDEQQSALEETQKITNKHTNDIESLLQVKEAEIMEV